MKNKKRMKEKEYISSFMQNKKRGFGSSERDCIEDEWSRSSSVNESKTNQASRTSQTSIRSQTSKTNQARDNSRISLTDTNINKELNILIN